MTMYVSPHAEVIPEWATPINLWPTLIWKFHYNFNYLELKPKIDNSFNGSVIDILPDGVIVNSNLESGSAVSSVYYQDNAPHRWDELQDFNMWLGEKISFVWHYFQFQSKGSHIVKSWLNIHTKGGETLEHYHNQTDLVVTSYITLPKNSGYIMYRDPLEYHRSNEPISYHDDPYRKVECEAGDVLIFPGWLRHKTESSDTDEQRIVLTYNIHRT